jgi:hypothetical protein
MRLVAIAVVAATTSLAHADPNAEITKAFGGFVDSFATAKPALDGVQALLLPAMMDVPVPVAADAANTFQAPKTKVLRIVPTKSGKAAWVAAEIATKVEHDKKWVAQSVRASAVLVLDGATWRVRAADFSVAVPERAAPPGCGNASDQWESPSKVAKAAVPAVDALIHAISDPATFVPMISDDKNALVFGSAPKETYSGGAAIKAIFKKWRIGGDMPGGDGALSAIADVGPDGELVWAITPIMAPIQMCAMYRGFFVLVKDGTAWKVIHQHYSSPFF